MTEPLSREPMAPPVPAAADAASAVAASAAGNGSGAGSAAARPGVAGHGAPLRWRVLMIALVAAAVAGALLAVLLARQAPAPPAAPAGAAELDALRAHTGRRVDELVERIEQLNGEVEAQRAQRLSLEQMVAEITQGRDELVLHEVERLLVLAQQDLQVAATPAAAIGALETAEQRLARAGRPQLAGLRRAVQRDLQRLRGTPAFDLAAQVARLDQLAAAVETWPLLADAVAGRPAASERPASASDRPAIPAPVADKAAKAPAKAAAAEPAGGETVRAWLVREFGELVRIQRVDAPEALLLPAAQQPLVRLQLKLRLLGARYALLTRNEALWRDEVAGAQTLLARYYDPRHPPAAAAAAQLRQLAGVSAPVKAPTLDESLAALAALRRDAR